MASLSDFIYGYVTSFKVEKELNNIKGHSEANRGTKVIKRINNTSK